MPQIKKPKTIKKVKVAKTKPKKLKKNTAQALVQTKNPKTKNTLDYYECLCHQTKQGLKGKKITKACQECKHNALTINKKMSAQKIKDVQKLAKAHAEFKQILEEYVQKH